MKKLDITIPNLLAWEIEDTYAAIYPADFNNQLIGADFPVEIDSMTPAEVASSTTIIQTTIDWIDTHQEFIAQKIIEQDYIKLAEKWVRASEKVSGKENCYLLTSLKESTYVTLPISEAEFIQAIQYSSINFIFTEHTHLEGCIIYVTFKPNYFSSHAIEVYLDHTYTLTVGGL